MGRALLIISAGLLITFSLVQGAMKGRQLSFSERSAEYIMKSQARNVANTGIELTLKKILDEEESGNDHWTNNGNWYEIPVENANFESGTARVKITRLNALSNPDTLKLTAAGNFTLNGELVSDTVATIVAEYHNVIPDDKAAVLYDGPSATPNYNGTSFDHDGRDYDLEGNVIPGSETKPGVLAKTQAISDALNTNLTSNQLDKITGDPDIAVDEQPNDNFNDLVSLYANNGDSTISGCPCEYNNATFGSIDQPQITVVEGDLTLKGGSVGAGILVVKDGGKLITRGDFTYHGIILVQGAAADMETSLEFSGNTYVYGGMMLGSADSNADLNMRIDGNIHLRYSSEARMLAQETARTRIPSRKTFIRVGVYE